MARINIEDSLFKDQRWFKLLIKCGDRHKALGIVTNAWILAQTHWVEFGCIPEKAWPSDLDILIDVELANKRSDGTVYVKGSKKAFSWLEQRVEAGRKGGLKKRIQNELNTEKEDIIKSGARIILSKAVASGKIIKPLTCENCGQGGLEIEGHHSDYSKPLEVDWVCKNCHTQIHRLLRKAEAKRDQAVAKVPDSTANPPSLTPSLSQTLIQPQSLIQDNTSNEGTEKKRRPKKDSESEANREQNRRIWDSYLNAFRLRYGVDPVRNGTVNAQVSQLRARLGTEDAIMVVEFYLKHNDSFYLKKTHSFGLCLKDAETLRTQMARGKAITNTMVRSFERTQGMRELFDRIDTEGI